MIKAVTFDLDGVVLHGVRFSDRYIKEFGIEGDLMRPFFVGPYQDCIVGKADLKEELKNGWMRKWGWKGTVEELLLYWFESGNTLDMDMLATVDALRAKKIITVLTTNQEQYRADYILNTLGLKDRFDHAVISYAVGYTKPDPHFFEALMDFLLKKDPWIEKKEVLFWDDRTTFVEGAKLFGLNANLYTDFAKYREEMQRLNLLS